MTEILEKVLVEVVKAVGKGAAKIIVWTAHCLIKTSAGSMTKFTIVRKRQRRRLLIQHQNRPRVLKHILRSREMNKQVLRQLIRPLKIKKRHQVEKDAQRLVAGVWLYLLCFSS